MVRILIDKKMLFDGDDESGGQSDADDPRRFRVD